MTTAYSYFWNALTGDVSITYSKDTANDSGPPRNIGKADSRARALEVAERHQQKVTRMNHNMGKPPPEFLIFI